MRVILDAAERVLSADPAASMEQIAETAKVARTTVHRRFANRQALLDALAESAQRQLSAAIDDAFPETAPVPVALHRATANVIRVKDACRFALSNTESNSTIAAQLWEHTDRRCLEMLARAKQAGLLAPTTDLEWTRQVYYALVGVALQVRGTRASTADPDTLATQVVTTLLHGGGPR
ncbi:TetR/AcrR family transcriptional regulator [Rhodococcus opacus]|uniref:TetR/AcrR family transcriptional regulator n=1 Tax=Rhodococcus opacus TaxID=37919 RepID=UPI00155A3EAF|nr:TetR/AcrR family transcriptional regulator [Rhodococcus opacus]